MNPRPDSKVGAVSLAYALCRSGGPLCRSLEPFPTSLIAVSSLIDQSGLHHGLVVRPGWGASPCPMFAPAKRFNGSWVPSCFPPSVRTALAAEHPALGRPDQRIGGEDFLGLSASTNLCATQRP